MNKQEIYENLKVGDLVYLDPLVVRTTWAKRWAKNKWAVEILEISDRKVDDYTSITGVCHEDETYLGQRVFDANRILGFADGLSKIKRESQRL